MPECAASPRADFLHAIRISEAFNLATAALRDRRLDCGAASA